MRVNNPSSRQADATFYKKSDLKKIKWIEGKWKGLDKGQPFYEIYQLINDSTLQVTSFDWDGKDSSQTSRSFVYWKEGAYYLGDQLNWKVTDITDKEIVMKRNYKASNDIIWRYKDISSWEAILESDKGVKNYHMERFDPFAQ
jgi:hypothetical protein